MSITKVKKFWCWNYEKEEKWLEDMFARGLKLVDIGYCRYIFEEGEQSTPNRVKDFKDRMRRLNRFVLLIILFIPLEVHFTLQNMEAYYVFEEPFNLLMAILCFVFVMVLIWGYCKLERQRVHIKKQRYLS